MHPRPCDQPRPNCSLQKFAAPGRGRSASSGRERGHRPSPESRPPPPRGSLLFPTAPCSSPLLPARGFPGGEGAVRSVSPPTRRGCLVTARVSPCGTCDLFPLPDGSRGARQGTSWQKCRFPCQHQCHRGRRATVSFRAGRAGVGQSPGLQPLPRGARQAVSTDTL